MTTYYAIPLTAEQVTVINAIKATKQGSPPVEDIAAIIPIIAQDKVRDILWELYSLNILHTGQDGDNVPLMEKKRYFGFAAKNHKLIKEEKD